MDDGKKVLLFMAKWIEISAPKAQHITEGHCLRDRTLQTLFKRGPRNKGTHLATSYNCPRILMGRGTVYKRPNPATLGDNSADIGAACL